MLQSYCVLSSPGPEWKALTLLCRKGWGRRAPRYHIELKATTPRIGTSVLVPVSILNSDIVTAEGMSSCVNSPGETAKYYDPKVS